MKTNDKKALQKMSKEELLVKLRTMQKELSINRIQHGLGRLKNTRILGTMCDDIAVIRTVLGNQKDIQA